MLTLRSQSMMKGLSSRRHIAATLSLLILLGAGSVTPGEAYGQKPGSKRSINVDAVRKIIRVSNGDLRFRITYDRRCLIDSLWIGKTLLCGSNDGGFTGFRVDSTWYTTRRLAGSPAVATSGDSLSIRNIRYVAGRDTIAERWWFALRQNDVLWMIERTLPKPLVIEENAFPVLQIDSIGVFDGSLLGNGGGAWFRLFNDSAIAYGVHTDEATLWSMRDGQCLQMVSRPDKGKSALALSRVGELLRCTFSVSPAELVPRFDEGTYRRRFVRGRTDVWGAATYAAGTYRQSLRLTVPDFQKKIRRGEFKGMNGGAITRILNTVARLGVIDSKLYGGNSWHTPYGPICIQEQYVAQFGLGINDENYTKGYKECLDYYRDHAIQPDGRIKARWAYTNEDAIPGTADSLGFYEAQWGIMMDSQPDFAINVAELFDQCGDLEWLRSHKQSCEKVLDYILRRDSDHDHLVEMLTDSHKEGRGSDWLDIMWASWENAFVNAEVYWALTLWSDLEILLGDTTTAESYRRFAAGLKESYNRSTREGGFWDEDHRWYVHWRDRDGSVYGNNLVTPVNFMAIGYGLCDDAERKLSILHTIETVMQRENLFVWPICVFPFEQGVGHQNNYPFPSYENGDLFLSWGELGVRAYAEDFPEIALRYCRNVIRRYEVDGLAYQRYLRTTQQGSGDDILAGNASVVTGLYRNIYGIQPRYNRLVIRPRLVKDLYGTRLRYNYRGKVYQVTLDATLNSVAADGTTVSATGEFGINRDSSRTSWYCGMAASPALVLTTPDTCTFNVAVREWADRRSWTEQSSAGRFSVPHLIGGLTPDQDYGVFCDGYMLEVLNAGGGGSIEYSYVHNDGAEHLFEVRAVSVPGHLRGRSLFSLPRPTITPADRIAFAPAGIRIRIEHEIPGAVIRYTRDGSEPTEHSAVYAAPLSITATTVIKARAFGAGAGESSIATATCTVLPRGFLGIVRSGEGTFAFHKALHRDVSLKHPYKSNYSGTGPNGLTDGILGGERLMPEWQGYERDDLEATIDLGKTQSIDSIRAGFLQDIGLWIFFPLEVRFSVSSDGRNFIPLLPLSHADSAYRGELKRRDYVYREKPITARYIRVYAKNQGLCPPGHPGVGGKAWLFADEIVVQ